MAADPSRRSMTNYISHLALLHKGLLKHAASAFFPSPFEQAVVITVDGVGE
jgi:predicted NodU family carbamoyl transferase